MTPKSPAFAPAGDGLPLAAALRQHQQRLSAIAVQVLRGDGVAALHGQPAGSLDVVFLDPPFAAASLYAPALAAAAKALRPGGFVYLEADASWQGRPEAASFTLRRHLKAGAVHAHLFCKPLPTEEKP